MRFSNPTRLLDINGMARHPNSDLPEIAPYAFAELKEELAVLRSVLNVDKNPHQIVAEDFSGVLPLTLNSLSF